MLLLNPQTENGHELGSCGVTTGVPGTGLRGRPARDSLTLSLSLHVRSLCMCQAGGETAVSLGPQEEPPNKTWYWALQSPRWVRSWQGGPGRRADSQERATHRPVQALPSPLHSALSKCVRLAVCLGAAAPEGMRRREGPRSRRAQVDEGEHLGVRRGGEPAVQRRHLNKKGGG